MKRVCVYCGSNPGNKAAFKGAARALAEELTRRNIGLVYGGASIGIMGVIADSVLQAGGEVIGVIPKALADKEIAHGGLTELVVVESMHQRKAMMADRSDGFIALPGGLGTLEEIFEVLTWAQLGFHSKPCALLNVDGYYDELSSFLDNTVTQGFVNQDHRNMLLVEQDSGAILNAMAAYEPPVVNKWIEREQI